MLVLSYDELREYTGYRQRAAIIRWLKANHIPFRIGGDGWPKVLHSALHGNISTPKTLTRSVVNASALMEMQRGQTKKAQVGPA